MKQLLINGQEVTMDVNTYFPFTYKLSSLDDVNVINFPSTKSINLPRTLVNDEIFGHIAEVTRQNYSFADNKVGVSFNQIKKGKYELIDNNKTISKGIIRIVNVTKDEYEIELYDQAIELLETLEDKYLNELTIINPKTRQPLKVLVNHSTVKDMMNGSYGVVPIFGNYETNYKTNTIYGRNSEDGGDPIVKLTLPEELTPLQLRTFPAGDVPYAIELTKMFDMIESSSDKEIKNKIVFSNDVKNLVKDVHMLLGKPKNELLVSSPTKLVDNTALHNNSTTKMSDAQFNHANLFSLVEPDKGFYLISNGNYSIRLEFELTLTTKSSHTNNKLMSSVSGDIGIFAQKGTQLGDFYVETKYSYDSSYTEPIKDKLSLVLGENAFYEKVNGRGQLKVYGTIVLNRNYFPKAEGRSVFLNQQFMNYGALGFPFGAFFTIAPFGLNLDDYTVDSIIRPSVVRKPLEFTEYDMLTSEKILPSDISIKDFIINLAKTYNLDIVAKNNKLNIDVKKFKQTNDVLLIDGEPDIDVGKVDFSKLIISPLKPQSQHISEYEEKLKKNWASKTINTGYTIKKSEEEIEIPYGTSLPIIDYNFFAYDKYGEYLNGGYARYPTGDIRGFDGSELVLGYIHKNNEKIYLIDTKKEDDKSVMINERLTHTEGKWRFNTEVFAPQSDVETYNTFLPYKIVDGIITESLEFNKPEYNFADFTDNEYSEETTLYDRFHKKMLIDKYDSNTHILTAKMFIDGLVDIYKIYNYKNSNYIISELVEYDPTEPDLYEVKLMRVNNINNYTNDDK